MCWETKLQVTECLAVSPQVANRAVAESGVQADSPPPHRPTCESTPLRTPKSAAIRPDSEGEGVATADGNTGVSGATSIVAARRGSLDGGPGRDSGCTLL